MSTKTPTNPSSYNPTELAKALALLLALLLGLTLWLGGWQPHTSDSLLGWSTGTITVTEGTDGDTGAHPLSPHDEGLRPASPNDNAGFGLPEGRTAPVEMGGVFFEGSGPGGTSIHPWSGGSRA
jgi:hypothetical protein